MRKLLLLLALVTSLLTVHAADYTYLTFETTDGAKTSVEVSSLTLTISGTTLTAGTQSFTLSNLSKMYFSTSDESTTGIKSLTPDPSPNGEGSEYYSLDGKQVANPVKGVVYIVKTKTGTYKIVKR